MQVDCKLELFEIVLNTDAVGPADIDDATDIVRLLLGSAEGRLLGPPDG